MNEIGGEGVLSQLSFEMLMLRDAISAHGPLQHKSACPLLLTQRQTVDMHELELIRHLTTNDCCTTISHIVRQQYFFWLFNR